MTSRSGSPARLIDIAGRAGVHASIVSRVLNNDPALSTRPETRVRIREIADELGYRPNAAARTLKTATARAFGVVLPTLRNPVWSRIMKGVLNFADHRDIAVLVSEHSDVRRQAPHHKRLIDEGRVDGLLLGGAEHEASTAAMARRIPMVHVNRGASARDVPSVVMDEARAVSLVADYARATGHLHMVHIDGPASIDTVMRRARELNRDWVVPTGSFAIINEPFTEKGGYRATRTFLSEHGPLKPKTMLTVAGLSQLIGALAALREHRLEVPADLSLMTYDDDVMLDYIEVRVSSVRMPLEELGLNAAHLLYQTIDGQGLSDLKISDPMSLVHRASTTDHRKLR